MKRFFRRIATTILVVAALATTAMGVGTTTAQGIDGALSSDALVVTITGLEKGSQATLTVSPEAASSFQDVLLERSVQSEGNSSITVEVPISLKDGYYKLLLEVPDIYFRTPKGYFFQVHNYQVVNPRNSPVTFDLIPPAGRQYEAYRGPLMLPGTDANEPVPPTLPQPGETVYRAEYMISLSAPPKQGESVAPNGIESVGYHYVGPMTWSDSEGVWGRIGVVDPGVRHDIWPNTEFVVDRVYVNRVVGGTQHWMEVGWAEVSWQGDYRYLYEYNSTYGQWRLIFQVETGASIDVALMHYSGNVWVALWWNGNYWVQVGYEDIGFSAADNNYNRGEIYTYDGNHPSLPAATTSWSALYIGGVWDRWDNTYWFSTSTSNDAPYDTHYTANYYDFYIHKHQ